MVSRVPFSLSSVPVRSSRLGGEGEREFHHRHLSAQMQCTSLGNCFCCCDVCSCCGLPCSLPFSCFFSLSPAHSHLTPGSSSCLVSRVHPFSAIRHAICSHGHGHASRDFGGHHHRNLISCVTLEFAAAAHAGETRRTQSRLALASGLPCRACAVALSAPGFRQCLHRLSTAETEWSPLCHQRKRQE